MRVRFFAPACIGCGTILCEALWLGASNIYQPTVRDPVSIDILPRYERPLNPGRPRMFRGTT